MKYSGHKRTKKRLLASAAAAVTAVGILLGGIFDTPAQLLETNPASPVGVHESLVPDSGDETGEAVPDSGEKRRSLRERLKLRILMLPLRLRALVCVPLWFVGWLLIHSVGALISPLLSPLVSAVLSVLCAAGLMLALLFMTVKAVYPDMPLKRIFSRRSLYTAFFAAVLLGAAGTLMQLFLPEYERLKDLAEAAVFLASMALLSIPLLRREAKHRERARLLAQSTRPEGQI